MSDPRDDSIGVLFLCTGNSARSIMAEAALATRGGRRFRSYSAGSHPKGAPHPSALETLRRLGYDAALVSGFRSKSWDEFSGRGEGAPSLDLVVTVCGNAAAEACPVWSGGPMTAHWGVTDPAAFVGPIDEELAVFAKIHDELAAKVDGLISLVESRFGEIERDGLGSCLPEIRALGEG